MHPTQLEILKALKTSRSLRFNEIKDMTAETSDNLSYHLGKMLDQNIIRSKLKGVYEVSEKGFEIINQNLDKKIGFQPSVSCMLHLTNTSNEWLVMRKLKQPNLGELHCPTFSLDGLATIDKQIDAFVDKYQIEISKLKNIGTLRKIVNHPLKPKLDKFFIVFGGEFNNFNPKIEDREFLKIPETKLKAENVLEVEELTELIESKKVFIETPVNLLN